MKQKILGVVAAVGAVMLPAVSLADTFGTSSAPTIVTSFITDVAGILGAVIASILGLLAALLGLGWGIRKFRHYVAGRKF